MVTKTIKYLSIFSALFFITGCTPQAYLTKLPVPMSQDEMSLKIVYETKLEKDKVFDLSLEWLAKTFTSSKSVIEYEDKTVGKIIGNGQISYILTSMGMSVPIPCNFTMSIEIKENRYRLVFENYRIGTYKTSITGLYKEEKDQLAIIKEKLKFLAEDLQLYLSNSADRDDW